MTQAISIKSAGGPIRIRPVGDLYRVNATLPGKSWAQDLFDGSAADSMEFATALAVHLESFQGWLDFKVSKALPDPLPGLTARVHKRAGEQFAKIRILDGKKAIANILFRHSTQNCCYVLGEQTIDGMPTVDKEWRRKGLSTWLHDMASEVAGKPMVPHSRYLSHGGLTDEGRAFWDARAKSRTYPGSVSTPELETRLEIAQSGIDLLKMEQRYRLGYESLTFAMTASLALGATIRTGGLGEPFHAVIDGRSILAGGTVAVKPPKTSSSHPWSARRMIEVNNAAGDAVVQHSFEEAYERELERLGGISGCYAEELPDRLRDSWRDTAILLEKYHGIAMPETMTDEAEARMMAVSSINTTSKPR